MFKLVLSEPANIASELRGILSPELLGQLDLDHITVEDNGYVEPDLRWRFSDILLSTRLRNRRRAYVYVLTEHQSKNDRLMAFRMLRYVVRIWERHLKKLPRTRRLPPVIPVVVHEGSGRWTAPQDLTELIDADEVLRAATRGLLPEFRYLLDDLGRLDPEELERVLRERPLTPDALLVLWTLPSAPDNPAFGVQFGRAMAGVAAEVLRRPGGPEKLMAVVNYVYDLGHEDALPDVQQAVARLGPDAEELQMTIASMLRAKGRVEGMAEALRRQLTIKFGVLSEPVSRRIETASEDELLSWTERVLLAGSLDEVFA